MCSDSMAKSIRSKIKKRFRTAKRQRVEAMVEKPKRQRIADKLNKVVLGQVHLFVCDEVLLA